MHWYKITKLRWFETDRFEQHSKMEKTVFFLLMFVNVKHQAIIWTYVDQAVLTHWGRVTHICVGKLTIIGSDNGLSRGRHQAIILTNAGILLIRPLGTNFSEFFFEIQTFSLTKIRLKMSSAKCCSFRLGLDVLSHMAVLNMGVLFNQHRLVKAVMRESMEK